MKETPPPLQLVPDQGVIEIRGARQNNLKGIDLDLPLGKLNVISGPSGSGKSSLAFDTIYAEGQRRYVETFSPYTRQFLDRMDKPKVDEIRGIPPAIAIEQSNPVKSTRSTVGTMTEINEYLKLLFPRLARAYCPSCSREIRVESAKSIVEHVFAEHAGETLLLTFGVPVPAGTKPADFFAFLQQQGYLRVWLEGVVLRVDEPVKVKRLPAVVPVVQDRVNATGENRSRFIEAVEIALRFGKGKIAFFQSAISNQQSAIPFSTGWHCAHCDIDIAPPSPGLFSFNHPLGACPTCRGFGRTIGLDLSRALPDRSLSVVGGVVRPFQTENGAQCQRDLLRAARARELDTMCPFEELSQADQDWILYGERNGAPAEELSDNGLWYGVKGFFDWLESKSYKMHVRVLLSRYRNYTECPDCRGGRYQKATMNFRVGDKTLADLMVMPVAELAALLGKSSSANGDATTEMLTHEVVSRLRYLDEVGLGYLSLDRPTKTLSGGEVERVNLTTCLGASLVNTLFVLDEPSIGLHPRDTHRLIRVMRQLRDKGNTLLVVEHDEAVIRAADNLVEIGPGRGEAGGELVFNGPLEKLRQSLTADYLTGAKSIPVPKKRRKPRAFISVKGAREHNLRNIDVEFPLGVLACVTGVSGSGKSTLVHDVLFRNLLAAQNVPTEEAPGLCKKLTGAHRIDQVVMVDQSPLSRTPRSSPALYLGVFDHVRELFADTEAAEAQGYNASTFSFNSGNGRCERCCGNGFEKIEMQFLSDVFIRCPECEGKRYQPQILEILIDGKSIHDVLQLTITGAIEFFGALSHRKRKRVRRPAFDPESDHEAAVAFAEGKVSQSADPLIEPLRILAEVGLGYLTLGQPLNVLSGGESQRLKLVERLTNQKETNALLIFDEPTTGLHFDDVAQLIRVFDRLVEQGNSVLVIEHNLEVIKCADRVIDLGPEAGTAGGQLVAAGTPEEIAACEASHTGCFLRGMLDARNAPGRAGILPAVAGILPATSNVLDASLAGNSYAADEWGALRIAEEPGRIPGSADRISALPKAIAVRGAREHNLKDISLDIPRDQMVIITGLSGSGKSTLAFDLLFAEGQRRFLDSMSPYARQFVEQLEKPDVDLIAGLPPSVAIEQRITRGGGKSTVATVTEVYHFLRLLFAKLGTQFCPKCDIAVEKQTVQAVTKKAEAIVGTHGPMLVLAPLVKARKGFHTDVARWAVSHGFDELLVDGVMRKAEGFEKLDRFREHTIDVVVGRSSGSGALAARGGRDASSRRPNRDDGVASTSRDGGVAATIKRALEIGKGTAKLIPASATDHAARRKSEPPHGGGYILSTEMSCPGCGMSFEELDPRLFSFNSPHGWCEECHGFGEVWRSTVDPKLESELEIEMARERQHEWLDDGEATPCPSCAGARLNGIARHVRLHGHSIDEFTALSVSEAAGLIASLKFKGGQQQIAQDIVPEIDQRLEFMGKVGLDYLALGRSAKTLSGGESQRIRLAAQLGSNLRGVLYVLDEPTIGLHARDNVSLLDTLEALKAKGNSLVIVEHDEDTMRRADTIIDLGPGAGSRGGAVVAQGTLDEIQLVENSATGRFLRDPLRHPTLGERRSLKDAAHWLELKGANLHNLKNLDVRFPLGRLSVVSGISGSGKSTLMRGVLKPLVQQALTRSLKRKTAENAEGRGGKAENHAPILQIASSPSVSSALSVVKETAVRDFIEAVYEVDQSPIGKTSRSTPATYIKVFDEIRALYAQMPLSRMRGYTASRFSFNAEGGRCETCAGQGVIKVEMNFLPTSYVPCTDCHGLRYNPATLEVLYSERSIGDVMEMTLDQAAEFFAAQPKIHRPLALLCDTGLGYLKLGQPSPTLSGGEAQRLKLVSELTRGAGRSVTARLRQNREPKSTLYLLEEPTIGLHMADVAELLKVLHRLVDDGATVIVIEHNLSLIADADYLVDIGPEAGAAGGEVVAAGTPEQVAKSKRSRTAPFLKETLGRPVEAASRELAFTAH